MLLGAVPLALLPGPGGLIDVSDCCLFKGLESDCETVVVSGMSNETLLRKVAVSSSWVEAAPSEVEVHKIPAAGGTVSG
jgi:hypothetical protein